MSAEPLSIDVGPLRSVSHFHYMIARQLSDLRAAVMSTPQRRIEWDLTSVDFDLRLSTAALTCFLAFASQVRQSFRDIPVANIDWNPRLQGFWKDIGVFDVVRKMDILEWPAGLVGGFESHGIHPSSWINIYQRPSATPEYGDDDWGKYKDHYRELLFADVSLHLDETLTAWERRLNAPGRLKRRLIENLAELILNSWTWGGASAFVGIQHTRNRLTAAVVDTGKGFYHSISSRAMDPAGALSRLPVVSDDLEAIMLGCILNHEVYALRGALHFVLTHGGWAVVASNSGELRLEKGLWDRVVSLFPSPIDRSTLSIDSVKQAFGEPINLRGATADERRIGYARQWHEKLVGSRVVFELAVEVAD